MLSPRHLVFAFCTAPPWNSTFLAVTPASLHIKYRPRQCFWNRRPLWKQRIFCARLLHLSSDLNAWTPGIQSKRNGTNLVKESLPHFKIDHKIFYNFFWTFPLLEILTMKRKASKAALQTDKNHTFERRLFSSDKKNRTPEIILPPETWK